ncbi:MAG: helix-turn-helix domain-containing protein [Myxococcota bacterium]
MKSEVTNESRQRPEMDSVERMLSVVGDRWTFLLLREAFFGVTRFEDFRVNTGASPAVLTDRLKRSVQHGLLERQRYGTHRKRFGYRLTEKGTDLYPIIVLMMKWGDRWLNDGASPIVLTHTCGATTEAMVLRCDGCGEVIEARDVEWSNGEVEEP